MLMYWDSIDSTFQPDPLLIQTSIICKISWKGFPNLNFWFSIFWFSNLDFLIYCFCQWIKITWSKFNFAIGLVFFQQTFTVIWYLKPFFSFKRQLNRSLILDLLASNCTIGSFFSIISTLYDIAYPLNAWLLRSVAHKKEVQLIHQCFLSVFFQSSLR